MRRSVIALLAATSAVAKPLAGQALEARQPASVSATATPTIISTGADNTACAIASAASASYASAFPSAPAAVINASTAVDCLNSIPFVPEDALQLLKSLRTYLEFQSDKEYLNNPPSGYVDPGYDLDGTIDAIQSNIEAATYESEIAFQLDIYYALQQAYDGHLYWQGDILSGVFGFGLKFSGLASVSIDGLADPQIYFAGDLVEYDPSGIALPRNDFTPSAVTKLNGVAITEAIETLALLQNIQDPDARYNVEFFTLGKIGTGSVLGMATSLSVPPNAEYYEFEFANKTTVRVPILASVVQTFDNVTDGQTAYEAFAPFASRYSNTSDTSVPTASPTETTSASATSGTATSTASATETATPNIPFFPYPVVKDDADLIAGYYLNDTGYQDVAVIQMTGFQPQSKDALDDWMNSFQTTLAYFLGNATADGKKKLVIDLQGNGGGSIDLGTDAAAQILASIAPNLKSNMRRSAGMDIIVSSASAQVAALSSNTSAEDFEALSNSPFAYQYDVDPKGSNIDSVKEMLDGITFDGTDFTAFFQSNYSDPLASDFTGFEITQTDPKAKRPFAAEDIIILTDGYCASTCTTFSEHMKNQGGIQFIMVGGRPQHGPVQAVGGIKGSQVFEYSNFLDMLNLFYNATDAELKAIANTEWDYFNDLPVARTGAAALAGDVSAGGNSGGVNGRNSFRIGDESNTPLQYVYEAADCRIWYTPEMLSDPVFLWNRVVDVAWKNRTGLQYNSPYCVAGSTGHPTSISGGWKQGTLGPQDEGKKEADSPIFQNAPWSPSSNQSDFDWSKVVNAETFASTCPDYKGDKWLLRMFCKAYNSIPS